jgi:hypothetical protein
MDRPNLSSEMTGRRSDALCKNDDSQRQKAATLFAIRVMPFL